jgi:hypothetical protein
MNPQNQGPGDDRRPASSWLGLALAAAAGVGVGVALANRTKNNHDSANNDDNVDWNTHVPKGTKLLKQDGKAIHRYRPPRRDCEGGVLQQPRESSPEFRQED